PPVQEAQPVSRGNRSHAEIAELALTLVGIPYVAGGSSRNGFDCSGFTKYVYAGSGIAIPRTSYDQFAGGTAVSRDDLELGDLLFFKTYDSGASHVGVYIGGGSFVHASNPRDLVKVTSLSDSYYASRYLGARRYE
ncbi:MAG: C40 family peptidase, partial [Peptococcaceae bacterium]|nr:C40 family peptidase [Peptococcaceae bacterium]